MNTLDNDRRVSIRSNRAIGLAALLLIGLGVVTMSPASAAEQVFAPPGHQFSILFPPGPKQTLSNSPSKEMSTWSGVNDKILYVISHETNTVAYDAENELTADLRNLMKEVGGTVIAQRQQTWPTQHEPAKALRVTFRTAKGFVGECMFVVDGTQSYGAAALDVSEAPRPARLTGIVDSLRILK